MSASASAGRSGIGLLSVRGRQAQHETSPQGESISDFVHSSDLPGLIGKVRSTTNPGCESFRNSPPGERLRTGPAGLLSRRARANVTADEDLGSNAEPPDLIHSVPWSPRCFRQGSGTLSGTEKWVNTISSRFRGVPPMSSPGRCSSWRRAYASCAISSSALGLAPSALRPPTTSIATPSSSVVEGGVMARRTPESPRRDSRPAGAAPSSRVAERGRKHRLAP